MKNEEASTVVHSSAVKGKKGEAPRANMNSKSSDTASGAAENKAVLTRIYAYKDYEKIDSQKIAEELNVSPQKVRALMGSALTNPKTWENYAKAFGYEDHQKPDWAGIGKDGLAQQAAAKAAAAVKSTGTPAAGILAPGSITTPRKRSRKEYPESSQGVEGAGPIEGPKGPAEGAKEAPQGASEASLEGTNSVVITNTNPSSLQEEIVEEMRKLQTHDPDLIPMAGGGYVKMVMDEQGRMVGVRPASEEETYSQFTKRLGQLISEQLTEEDIEMKTIGLMKKIALNPAVTLGYTYVTHTMWKDGVTPLYRGDLSDMVNDAVAYWLRGVFGITFGIVTSDDCEMNRYFEAKMREKMGDGRYS